MAENQTPFEPVYRVSFNLRSGGVNRKYFESAEACREWFVANRGRFTSSTITEMNSISFERLCMFAQLERECELLGCERQ